MVFNKYTGEVPMINFESLNLIIKVHLSDMDSPPRRQLSPSESEDCDDEEERKRLMKKKKVERKKKVNIQDFLQVFQGSGIGKMEDN